MFGADVPVQQAIGFFGSVLESAFDISAERDLDGVVERRTGLTRSFVRQAPNGIR